MTTATAVTLGAALLLARAALRGAPSRLQDPHAWRSAA